jgi:hypothetical protein
VALAHPACDRAACAEVDIVGVCGDNEDLHRLETTQESMRFCTTAS